MRNAIRFILPAAAILLTAMSTSQAQVDGYRFGVGWGYAGNNGNCNPYGYNRNFLGLAIAPTPRIDAPPFFAQFPPVYYTPEIVARPYGVSPYAAPPGIAPVEMGGGGPLHQVNPYYVDPVSPMPSDGAAPQEKSGNGASYREPKTTWIQNPYYQVGAIATRAVVAN